MFDTRQKTKETSRKVTNMIARGIVKLVKGTFKTQKLQVSLLADEVRDDVEYAEPFGFTTSPPIGSEVIVLFIGGNRDHASVISAFNKAHRPTDLAAGEACVYNAFGHKIHLKADGTIEITCTKVLIKGNLEVEGDILDRSTSNSRTVKGMRDVYNSHTHPETGATTTAPNQSM